MSDTKPTVGTQVDLVLGPLPDRAAFEAAAEARGLNTARDPEWHRFDGMQEDDRPYYNGRTDAAWWAWQTGRAAERERWEKAAAPAVGAA